MKIKLTGWALTVALLSTLAVGSSALAQSDGNATQSTESGASQSTKSTTTTTTKSSAPNQTTVTRTTVDPLWLALGGVGLLALLAILFAATRGRSRDTSTTAVHERETVIKK